jgi:hypothetical protein
MWVCNQSTWDLQPESTSCWCTHGIAPRHAFVFSAYSTYALHCVNNHTRDPELIITGPAIGNPHLAVLYTIHSDVKCAKATK